MDAQPLINEYIRQRNEALNRCAFLVAEIDRLHKIIRSSQERKPVVLKKVENANNP